MADLSTINSALKQTWTEDRLAEQLYAQNPILERVKKLKKTEVGKQALTAVHVNRNWGYTASPSTSGGTPSVLNTAGSQGTAQAAWNYCNFHMPIKVEGDAIDGTVNDTLSVAQLVDLEVSGALMDLNRQISRQIVSNGDGLVIQCGTTSASTTVVLNATDATNAFERGWIDAGALVDIGTTGDSDVIAGSRTVSAPSISGSTLVISGGAVTTSSSHYVSLTSGRSTTDGSSRELNGLRNIVSTSATLGGINPATQPSWAAANVDSTAQTLSLGLIYTAQRKVQQKVGKIPTQLVVGLKQAQNLYSLIQAQVRFSSDKGLTAGAVQDVGFNNMEVLQVPDVRNEDLYVLTLDDLLLLTAGEPYWVNKVEGAGGPLRWAQGTDAYVSKITYRANLGARRRNSHAALTGLT